MNEKLTFDYGESDNEEHDPSNDIAHHFETSTKNEIEPLVIRLNQINSVKLCGGLGMCFNCRNKHIGDQKARENQMPESLLDKRNKKNVIRTKYGQYFKKKLAEIIEPQKASYSTDNLNDNTTNTASSIRG